MGCHSGLASPRVISTREAFVFCVVEVKPRGQADAHGAVAASLQESFPGVSISDSVLLVN